MSEVKYCWVNLHTGEFSNSWGDDIMSLNRLDDETKQKARAKGYVLIEYKCLNDQEFEFYKQMKLK